MFQPFRKKKQLLNEYEAEYEINNLPSAIFDYIIAKGITQKFIKGISREFSFIKFKML